MGSEKKNSSHTRKHSASSHISLIESSSLPFAFMPIQSRHFSVWECSYRWFQTIHHLIWNLWWNVTHSFLFPWFEIRLYISHHMAIITNYKFTSSIVAANVIMGNDIPESRQHIYYVHMLGCEHNNSHKFRRVYFVFLYAVTTVHVCMCLRFSVPYMICP